MAGHARLGSLLGPRATARRRVFGPMAIACIAVAVVSAQESARGTLDGWRQAEAGYALEFPRDHGSHPDYRIEWWYYTGNLSSDDGRRFGYQVTFFRFGVDPAPENPSRWAVRDLFMAHLAVTDIGAGRQLVAERLDRGGVGWAGARAGTLDVWNGDWRVELDGGTHRLRALDREFGVDLRLGLARGRPHTEEMGSAERGPSPATPPTTTR